MSKAIGGAPLIGDGRYNLSILIESGILVTVSLRDGFYGAGDILGVLVMGFDYYPAPAFRELDQ